jgi:PAS domain S-box-containing protein
MLVALAGGAPALLIAMIALVRWHADELLRWTIAGAAIMIWLGCAFAARARFARPLQTLSNLLAALREGDTSLRARGADPDDSMGLALWEINALADQLKQRRYETFEAVSLLRQVLESIDVALFTFDPAGRLRLVNRGAEELLRLPAERALGRDAESLGLSAALEGETPRLVELQFPGRAGRWEVRRGTFRRDGQPHQLVVLSDLSRALREEERIAWIRLIRVLSHEINNSLAPIQSIAGSLRGALERTGEARAGSDLSEGLGIVEARAQSLARFMNAYARLARLPAPAPAPVEVREWIQRVVALEQRRPVEVREGPAVALLADGDQLDQLLINLVRNAAEAALETSGHVTIAWKLDRGWLEVSVEDDGPGIADTQNLFVPFFTTKPDGTGIGLALSRQIAESHGGTLALANREGARGCVARLRLPIGRGADAAGVRAGVP